MREHDKQPPRSRAGGQAAGSGDPTQDPESSKRIPEYVAKEGAQQEVAMDLSSLQSKKALRVLSYL